MSDTVCHSRPGRAVVVTRSVAFDAAADRPERVVADQVRALCQLGWKVSLCSPGRLVTGHSAVEQIDVPWPTAATTPGTPGFGLAYWIWVRRVAWRLRALLPVADSLYLLGGAAGVLRWLGPVRAGKPVVANPLGVGEFGSGEFPRSPDGVLVQHLIRYARFASVILATDEDGVTQTADLLGLERSRIRLLPEILDGARTRRAEAAIGKDARLPALARDAPGDFTEDFAEKLSEALLVPQRRVVQVARHIGPGTGVAQVVHSLEEALLAAGVACDRLTLANTGLRLRTQISRNPIHKSALMCEVIWFSTIGTAAVRRRMRLDPDAQAIVHGDPIGGDLYVNHGLLKVVMRNRQGARKLYIPANPMHWFTLARDEYRYRGAHQGAIVCLSEKDRDSLQRLYPTLKSTVRVVPNGVDLARFADPGEAVRREVRSSLGFRADEIVLLFVGHEYDRKGLFVLLDALSRLPRSTRLLVVGGDGEMIRHAKGRAEGLSVGDRVVFLGRKGDPAKFYAASDVLVLPSLYESSGLTMYEALAAGRQCVVTRVGIAPEIVKPGVNGEIVERTAQSVQAGIQRATQRLKESAFDTKAACRESVQGLGWPSVAARYLALLDEVGARD